MLDSHTHSHYSMDSDTLSDDMVQRAIELGASYIAITDHYNADYINIATEYRDHSKELHYPLNIEGHIADVKRLRSLYGSKISIALGIECGYSKDAEHYYSEAIESGEYDVVINSVHTIDHGDIYDPIFYTGKDRDYVMHSYLETIRESIDAPYNYNIVGHIGYLARKAPYEDNLITYAEFPREIDGILKAIIERDKCLECNAKTKNTPFLFLPGTDILRRYYELGGRRISYGSDAHMTGRICEKYDDIARVAESIGFEGFTYYIGGQPHIERF